MPEPKQADLNAELMRPEVRALLHQLASRPVSGDLYFERLTDGGWRVLRNKTPIAEGADMIKTLNNALKVKET